MKYLIALLAALAVVSAVDDPVNDAAVAFAYYCDEDPNYSGECVLAVEEDCYTDSCVEGIQ